MILATLLEVLDFTLMLLGLLTRFERAEISAFSGLRVNFS